MQVYLVTWKDQIGDPEAFRNFNDIEPSIRISWSQAKGLKIESKPRATGGPQFVVSGEMDGKPFTQTLDVKRLSVYDSPTHL